MAMNIRGLNAFITRVRCCKNVEQEQTCVQNELAKIRNKFTTTKQLNMQQRKKNVWKLMYIYILGYEVDFGQSECTSLINSNKYQEKYAGYIATSVLVSEQNHDLFKIIQGSIKNDLLSNNEHHQSLAISMIAAQAPKQITEFLAQDIQTMAFNDSKISMRIRKKACLCLLRMLRKYSDQFNPKNWVNELTNLISLRLNGGFLTAAVGLLLGICQLINPEPFNDCMPKLVTILYKISIQKELSEDYNYYQIPSPWLQVKVLKILQLLQPPQPETEPYKQLSECLKKIIRKTEVTRSVNRNNAEHSILFEAANYIIIHNNLFGAEFKGNLMKLLGIFINVREPNLRYLGLETMCKFAQISNQNFDDHLKTIFTTLRENDISIRKRALELLYLISNPTNCTKIVDELLKYSESGADLQIKDELTLKIAILAEKFADNLYWYIDVIIRMLNSSGAFVSEDIWYRIIQIIVGFNNESNIELQKYACQKFYAQLQLPHADETLICISAFILSEFSHHLVDLGKEPKKIFEILYKHFGNCTEKCKIMLLNAFLKLGSKYPDLRGEAMMLCEQQQEHYDPDVQQRGVEYLQILFVDDQIQGQIVSKMPTYSEIVQQNNPLLKKIYKMKFENKEKDPTTINQAKRVAQQEVEKAQEKFSNMSLQEAQIKHITWLKGCPYFQYCQNMAVEGINIMVPNEKNILKEQKNQSMLPFQNQAELKINMTQIAGKIVDTSEITVQYKGEFNGQSGKIALQFESTQYSINNLSIMIMQTNGLLFNISPVKQGKNPQVLIQVQSVDGSLTLPVASLFYDAATEQTVTQKKFDFALPVYPHKFTQQIDMPYQKFIAFFEEFTVKQINSYFKLDTFLKNPAPPNVSMADVLKKFGGLLNSLNLKAQPYPSIDKIDMIWATGQYIFKPLEQNNILNFPVMIIVQAFEEQTREIIRISIRCGGSGELAKSFLDLLTLYIS